jgi:predicted CXXCH cytochrome family protein
MKANWLILAAISLLIMSGTAIAQNSIITSKHDMTSGAQVKVGGYDNPNNSVSLQVCVYCHTPHNVGSTEGPLWNHDNVTANNGYQLYETTVQGTDTDAVLGAESMACMGCHDGTAAVDAIINPPRDILLGDWDTDTTGFIEAYASVGTDLRDDHPVSIQYLGVSVDLLATPTGNIPLFGDSDDRVECASCHDVHDDSNAAFLRVTDVGSGICLACHIK